MANGVKWIKIATDIFEDEKMVLISNLEDGALYELVWLKLLTLAGKNSNDGVMMLTDSIPYTPKMLSTIFRMNEGIVTRAIEVFIEFEMIHMCAGAIVITNWNVHQSIELLNAKRERDREYQRKRRQMQKTTLENESSVKDVDMSSDIVDICRLTSDDSRLIEKEREEEIEIEKEKEKDIVVLCDTKVHKASQKTNTTITFTIPTPKKINSYCDTYAKCIDAGAIYNNCSTPLTQKNKEST